MNDVGALLNPHPIFAHNELAYIPPCYMRVNRTIITVVAVTPRNTPGRRKRCGIRKRPGKQHENGNYALDLFGNTVLYGISPTLVSWICSQVS